MSGNGLGSEDKPPRAPSRAALAFRLFDALGVESRKDWLVDKLLGAGEASSFYGEPGSGKSVLAEDLGLHVAAGRNWHGREVRQGAVLYLALERAQLVERRAVAFRRHTGLDALPFAVVGRELDFRDTGSAEAIWATCLALEAEASQQVNLVIVDTISRALCGGDENSPKDMGALVRTIARIIDLTKAHVLSVHHSPADGSPRQRGHSNLKGALDTTVHIQKSGNVRTATVTKANDSEEGEALSFTLAGVEIYRDGDTITTAPVVEAASGSSPISPPRRKLSDRQKLALDAMSRCAVHRGKEPPATFNLPMGINTITIAEWREEMISAGVIEQDVGNPREAFRQIKRSLQARHLIAERDGVVWMS